MRNRAFLIRENGEKVWKAICDDKIIPAEFNSRGAALAGIDVQKRRNENFVKRQNRPGGDPGKQQ